MGALNLIDSPFGRALRALHGSEMAARTVGIDVAGVQGRGLRHLRGVRHRSGLAVALQNKLRDPNVADFMHSIEMVTMVVLGGMASVLGSLFGAVLLTTLPQVADLFKREYVAFGSIRHGSA